MEDERTSIRVVVAQRANGPVFEALPARRHGLERYELLASPGLVRSLVLSIPAGAGLATITAVFDAYTLKTGVQWYFANVYQNVDHINDDTLLDWWQ